MPLFAAKVRVNVGANQFLRHQAEQPLIDRSRRNAAADHGGQAGRPARPVLAERVERLAILAAAGILVRLSGHPPGC